MSDTQTLQEQLQAERLAALGLSAGGGSDAGAEGMQDLSAGADAPNMDASFAEAIIIVDREQRPALLVRNNTFEQPTSPTWKTLLNANKLRLEKALRSVGRLELEGHPTFPYVGTAWMLGSKGLAITNRHVAEIFSQKSGSSFVFQKGIGGRTLKAKVDFREESGVAASSEIMIEKVLFVADPGSANPDMAIVKLANHPALPPPIQLFTGVTKVNQPVAVIGYPANDPRNPAAAVSTVFGAVFEVKRLSPGMVTKKPTGFLIEHDCSTLGGNSGSAVIDIETGQAVGLHFGGSFRQANFAVTASQIQKILTKLKVQVAVPIEVVAAKKKEKAPKASKLTADFFKGREGYQPNFLGTAAALQVPLPKVAAAKAADVTKVKGTTDNVLRYTHFSLVMSASRRLCHFAAVNIDGSTALNIRRDTDVWNMDPRIPDAAQIGNELYSNNDLDRGHMVRRLDPVWGKEAQKANDDTFVYTNSTPQHARLNQKTWNDLEDYILTNTKANGLRVNVFTGPLFGATDPVYRGVKLPEQFWKVVSVVNGDTKKLHATAYILSQKDLISELEFVFGQFRTYQLPIATLEKKAGLSFGKLSSFDPLRAVEAFPIREIGNLNDIVL